MQKLLSFDPDTGALDWEGVVDSRTRTTFDQETGRAQLEINKVGGVAGAMRRATRFRRYIETWVARSEQERELLAWLDPVCGRSIEEWLWGCEVKAAVPPVDEEGHEMAVVTWKALASTGSGEAEAKGEGEGRGRGRRREAAAALVRWW